MGFCKVFYGFVGFSMVFVGKNKNIFQIKTSVFIKT